jgi:hypothetical protein
MRYLSNLYKATFKKIRGKAKDGFIRPTLCQFFKTNKDFSEVISDLMLTWPGSTHRESEVIALGGEVFDTGNGTIGKVPLASVPSGWEQADNWQRYSVSSWGGDMCGRFKSYGPTVWSNELSVSKSSGGVGNVGYYSCSDQPHRWHADHSHYVGATTGDVFLAYEIITSNNTNTNRLEVGIY